MASIAKRDNGQWRARYRDETGRERSKHFDRKVDASRWLALVTASVVRGDHIAPEVGQVTFGAFCTAWSARQVWAPTTVLAMGLAARSVTFAAVPLRSLRRSHVEQWVKIMTTRGLAASTIHTRVQNVRAVLRGAVADRLIASDPSEGVALPRRRRAEQAMVLPTTAQVGAIMASADAAFRPYVALCAFAGLRLGEASGVQVGDVDFLRRTLAVTRQVQRADGGAVDVRPPKYGSERTVFLAPALVELLAGRVEPDSELDAWLFAGPPHQNTIGHRWRMTTKRAGVAGVRLHDLRHFYASGLIAAGCDVVTVQRALGHASATTTLSTYSHLWPSGEDRTRAAAEAMLAEATSCGPVADRETLASR